MRWVLARSGTVIYRGSREDVLTVAERYRLVCHVVPEVRGPVPGRGFYDDSAAIPPRLMQNAVILPEEMLPARLRRRAA
ncbi:hypothetical protein [Methylobacterium sp. CM6246]